MADAVIRPALIEDSAAVLALLSALAEEIGDGGRFRSTEEAIRRYGFGPDRLFWSTLAFAEGAPAGLVVFFPTFSTTRGSPGVYVQDLYVGPASRGMGLGRGLLRAASREAEAAWGATHLTLMVHEGNHEAVAFYARLGFVLRRRELPASLDGAAFAALGSAP